LVSGEIADEAPAFGQLVITVAVVEDVYAWKARIVVVPLRAAP
jgi:hypothetical protein